MKEKRKNIFADYEEKRRIARDEMQNAGKVSGQELQQLRSAVSDGNLVQFLRDNIVPEGSGLDKTLSFLGFRSTKKDADLVENREPSRKNTPPQRGLDRWKQKVYDFGHEASAFVRDPERGGVILEYLKPILLGALLGFARRGVHSIFSRILRFPFSRKKRRK